MKEQQQQAIGNVGCFCLLTDSFVIKEENQWYEHGSLNTAIQNTCVIKYHASQLMMWLRSSSFGKMLSSFKCLYFCFYLYNTLLAKRGGLERAFTLKSDTVALWSRKGGV